MLLVEEQFRRVAHLTESSLLHLVDAQFGGAAEAVFYASQYAVHIMLVALKLYDRIDDMFEYLRSCQSALLGDMSDEHHRHAAGLGEAE